jgi:hypothetical protein
LFFNGHLLFINASGPALRVCMRTPHAREDRYLSMNAKITASRLAPKTP